MVAGLDELEYDGTINGTGEDQTDEDPESSDEIQWNLDEDGTLTISGTGEMWDAPWKEQADDITHVIIEEGITLVGSGAFYGCTSLESVSLPDTLMQIYYETFKDCTNLEKITIPSSVEYIGKNAFDSTVTICGYDDTQAWYYTEDYGNPFESMGSLDMDDCYECEE